MEFKSCSMISKMFLNINGRIDADANALTLCCERISDKPAVPFQKTAEETLKSFVGMRSLVVAESLKSAAFQSTPRFTSGCLKCDKYQTANHNLSMLISYVNLSMYPSPCQCRCCYCEDNKKWDDTPEVHSAYEKLFDMLRFGKQTGMIASNAIWQVSPGEITIHPYRKEIMELVKGQRANFYTNAFIYDESIAENLHSNPGSAINLSIDCGTPSTWKKVKGFDNFDEVTSNLVKYYKACSGARQITLKYIILPDINDIYEDFIALIEIMKILNVRHLSISRDGRKKYNYSNEYHVKMIGGAAYLAAICFKNHISFDLFPYTVDEQQLIKKQTEEILSKGYV